MEKPRLDVLRVERARANSAARRQAHDEGHRSLGAVEALRGHVDDLIEAARDEVGKLHLDDRPPPQERAAHGDAHRSGLGDRRVDDAVVAELIEEATCDRERPAELGDVLSHEEDAFILTHRMTQRDRDGLEIDLDLDALVLFRQLEKDRAIVARRRAFRLQRLVDDIDEQIGARGAQIVQPLLRDDASIEERVLELLDRVLSHETVAVGGGHLVERAVALRVPAHAPDHRLDERRSLAGSRARAEATAPL